jgi:hypothetical protein
MMLGTVLSYIASGSDECPRSSHKTPDQKPHLESLIYQIPVFWLLQTADKVANFVPVCSALVE